MHKKSIIITNATKDYYKLNSLNIFMNETDNFEIEKRIIDNLKEINDIYLELKPDILFIDTIFNEKEKIEFLKGFHKINTTDCKIIMTFKNTNEREHLEKIQIVDRFLPCNPNNRLVYDALKEMTDDNLFVNKKKVISLIEMLDLNINSPAVAQFAFHLMLLSKETSRYLLTSLIYNIHYSVSAIEKVSSETIRKNFYKIRVIITEKLESNQELQKKLFGTVKLNSLDISSFFEYFIEYLEKMP